MSNTISQTPVAGAASNFIVVDGSSVVFTTLEFQAAERKHITKMAPFILEPQISTAIEDTHFAFGTSKASSIGLAYCDKEAILSALAGCDDKPISAYADYSLLPLSKTPCLAYYQERIIFRQDEFTGFSLEPELARKALAISFQQNPELLEQDITVFASGKENEITEVLPKACKAVFIDQRSMAQYADTEHSINLLQGEFAQKSPVRQKLKTLKLPIVLSCVALLLLFLIQLLELRTLRQTNSDITHQISTTASSALGRKIMGNSRQQLNVMRSQYKLQQNFNHRELSPLLANVMSAIFNAPGTRQSIKIVSLEYIGKTHELSINIEASDFESLQSMQQRISAAGMKVELLNSRQEGQAQLANIKIGQASGE